MASAMRKAGLAKKLVGCGPQALRAQELGLIDQAIDDPALAVGASDLVVLAAPPSVLPELREKV